MSSGTGNLPNQGMVAVPFDIITSQWGNDIIENIESIASGPGIGDNAITTTKLADGSVTAPKVDFTTFVYSTTEKVVGKWSDGKTIYQKIFTGTISATATTTTLTTLGASGYLAVIRAGGWWEIGSGVRNLVGAGAGGANNRMSDVSISNSGALRFGTVSDLARTNLPYEVWVEYTKV